MQRRQFITILGGAAAWPLTARAQQAGGIKRIGMLMPITAEDPLNQAREVAFFQGLQQLGWTDGRNIRIDIRAEARVMLKTSQNMQLNELRSGRMSSWLPAVQPWGRCCK
ncbi:MAG: hypothetical protein WCB22_18220 [Pseudolabrys sp.]